MWVLAAADVFFLSPQTMQPWGMLLVTYLHPIKSIKFCLLPHVCLPGFKLDLVLKSHGPVFIISWSLVEAMIVSLYPCHFWWERAKCFWNFCLINIATPPWILGLQWGDQTAMLAVETIAKFRSSLMASNSQKTFSTNMAAVTSGARYQFEQYVLLTDEQEFHLLCNKKCQLHWAFEQAVITSLLTLLLFYLFYPEIISNSRALKPTEQYWFRPHVHTVILNTVKGFSY